MIRLASLVIRHKSKYVDREYSYIAGEDIQVGHRVLVQFGNGKQLFEAIVMSLEEVATVDDKTKKIIRKIDSYQIPEAKLALARWIRQEYLCSLNEAVSLFIPKTGEVSEQYEKYLIATVDQESLVEALENSKKNAKNIRILLELLLQGEINLHVLQRDLQKSLIKSAESLEKNGLARIEERRSSRIPQSEYHIQSQKIHLSKRQKHAQENIEKNIQNQTPTLLYGVTGSGKTEVYIQLIEQCLKRGKQAILLVPEISLTPQTIARFKNIFGDKIGVFHSQISAGERKDQNDLIENGEIRIVIGARSALFSPLEELGLIIIDECHDDAYKSEQSPKYDSIKIAEKLCAIYGAGLVLGSATPTVEQYYDAVYGAYDLQELPHREKGQLPSIELINILEEYKKGNTNIIGVEIIEKIKAEIDEDKQVIVFLNRRGYANTLSCNNCGHTVMCPSCDISLTYHKSNNKLLCHYCGHTQNFEATCSECGQGTYRALSYGTQKIEADLSKTLKNAKIIRLDRDTTNKKGGHEKLLQEFKDKKANILVGTQMISKGLDFEDVSLVVILNADQGLHFPDYRSNEKTLSMLLQVSGRAGRGEKRGKVLVQTADVENKIFEYLKNHNYSDFFWDEIKERKAFLYPPFTTLIRILCSSENYKDSAETAEKIKNAIEFYLKKRNMGIVCLGPVPNLIHKIDKKYRWQLFYKIQSEDELYMIKNIISYVLSEKRKLLVNEKTTVTIDINPKNLI